jgi:hypothetical protein
MVRLGLRRPPAALTQLRHHLSGEQLHLFQVGHVEHLQVSALDAGFGERAEPVDDLGR